MIVQPLLEVADTFLLLEARFRYRIRIRNASDDVQPIHLHRHAFELTIWAQSAQWNNEGCCHARRLPRGEVDFVADNPG
jgi:hypothetical protein